MEGHIAISDVKLLDDLKFATPKSASYVNSRESVMYWPSGGNSYAPNGVKFIILNLNGDNWLDCKRVKLFSLKKNLLPFHQ